MTINISKRKAVKFIKLANSKEYLSNPVFITPKLKLYDSDRYDFNTTTMVEDILGFSRSDVNSSILNLDLFLVGCVSESSDMKKAINMMRSNLRTTFPGDNKYVETVLWVMFHDITNGNNLTPDEMLVTATGNLKLLIKIYGFTKAIKARLD